jgi:hypothetical protein
MICYLPCLAHQVPRSSDETGQHGSTHALAHAAISSGSQPAGEVLLPGRAVVEVVVVAVLDFQDALERGRRRGVRMMSRSASLPAAAAKACTVTGGMPRKLGVCLAYHNDVVRWSNVRHAYEALV